MDLASLGDKIDNPGRDAARPDVCASMCVGADAVSQIDINTRRVAGDNARVVVTVGADQNQAQQFGQG